LAYVVFYYSLTPTIVVISFLTALLINGKIYFKNYARSTIYLPSTLPISAVCLVWTILYNPYFGVFAQFFKFIGLEPINWLGDPKWAMPAIAITTIWWTMGFPTILYIAALQQIPPSCYEAAELDGAGAWQKLFFITIPLLKRTHMLVTVFELLSSLQIFGQVYVMTGGGPIGKTRVLLQYIYEQGFRYFRMGYAQAIAFVFFLMMIGLAYLQIRLMMGKEESV